MILFYINAILFGASTIVALASGNVPLVWPNLGATLGWAVAIILKQQENNNNN